MLRLSLFIVAKIILGDIFRPPYQMQNMHSSNYWKKACWVFFTNSFHNGHLFCLRRRKLYWPRKLEQLLAHSALSIARFSPSILFHLLEMRCEKHVVLTTNRSHQQSMQPRSMCNDAAHITKARIVSTCFYINSSNFHHAKKCKNAIQSLGSFSKTSLD